MGVRHDRSKPGRARCGDIIAGDGLILTEIDGEDLHDHVLLCVRKEQFHLDSPPGSQGAHGLHGFFLWGTKCVPTNVCSEFLTQNCRDSLPDHVINPTICHTSVEWPVSRASSHAPAD